MPTLSDAEDTICQTLSDAWADRTPIDWPNVEAEGPHLRDGSDPWAALHIQHGGSDQHSFGQDGERTFTRVGSLTLQVFVPAGQRGLSAASALAMVAADAFEGKTVDGVRFYRVGTRTVGRDGSWFQVNVTADFEFDEVK